MLSEKTKPFDPAQYLGTSEAIDAYTAEALETGDPAFISDAQEITARAKKLIEVTVNS